MYIVYKPTISFEDRDECGLILSQEMREYLENHHTRENYDECEDSMFTIDIDEETKNKIKDIATNEDEQILVEKIEEYHCEYLNIDPRVFVC